MKDLDNSRENNTDVADMEMGMRIEKVIAECLETNRRNHKRMETIIAMLSDQNQKISDAIKMLSNNNQI